MNRANRAAQFQPFDALKGLQEELRMREERRNRVAKKEVSDEKAEEISKELRYRKVLTWKLFFIEMGVIMS